VNKGLWAVSLLLILLGLICIAAAVALSAYRKGRERLSASVTAKVVDLVLRKNEKPEGEKPYSNVWHPVFEFYADGVLYKVICPKGWMPSRYEIGDDVKLKYDPENPTVYHVEEKDRHQDMPVYLEITGAALIAAGIMFFICFASTRN
jgi:hypothetical protein